MCGWAVTLRPAVHVEVFVHEELAEGEEAKRESVRFYFPPLLVEDTALDSDEVLLEVEVFDLRQGGQFDPKVSLEQEREGEVVPHLFAGVAKFEPLVGRPPPKLDRNQDEGGAVHDLAVVA